MILSQVQYDEQLAIEFLGYEIYFCEKEEEQGEFPGFTRCPEPEWPCHGHCPVCYGDFSKCIHDYDEERYAVMRLRQEGIYTYGVEGG